MPRKKATTKTYPLIPLRGLMVFPRMILHFDVGRVASVAALEKAMMQDQQLVLAVQRDEGKEDPGFEDLWPVGMVAQIKQVVSLPGDALRVLVEGRERVVLQKLDTEENVPVAVCGADSAVVLQVDERNFFEKAIDAVEGSFRGILEYFR